jgi:hypothetical protein
MITRRGKLEDVNEAFRAMKAGEVARSVLVLDEAALASSGSAGAAVAGRG